MSHKFPLCVSGLLLIGYCLLQTLFIVRSGASSPEQSALDICSSAEMKTFLGSKDSISTEEVELLYHYCRDQFLDKNRLSSTVKQTVDEWIGTDLSKAETNEIFLALELSLSSPKPDKVSEKFELDCKEMSEKFQSYYDTIEPLTSYLDINLDSLLAHGNNEIDDHERDLFNYVQYSQFCRLILNDE